MSSLLANVAAWLLLTCASVAFHFKAPSTGNTIWAQSESRQTLFTQHRLITSVFWIAILVLQFSFMWHLLRGNPIATLLHPYFLMHNLLTSGFLFAWVSSAFWFSEFLLLADFANLSTAYFCHGRDSMPPLVHISTISGPLSWDFMAIYWVGSAGVNSQHLAVVIAAYVTIWVTLGYGAFFACAYHDYTVAFVLSILLSSVGLAQVEGGIDRLQSIFAFFLAGVLCLVCFADWLWRNTHHRFEADWADPEKCLVKDVASDLNTSISRHLQETDWTPHAQNSGSQEHEAVMHSGLFESEKQKGTGKEVKAE